MTAMTTPVPLRPLAEDLYVAPQLGPEAMAELARLGFRSVINNRPDFEGGPDQPTHASIAAAAAAAGLEYRFQPVHSMLQSAEDVAAFAALLDELPRPTLVFCRSGARSTRLYMASLAARG
jgi:uncharacterized protein (TIGR01244 family)